MLTMREGDRRQLTGNLLRLLKAAEILTEASLASDPQGASWAGAAAGSDLNATPLWDGNSPFVSVRSSMSRSMLAGLQHGLALFELSRSTRGHSVTMATVTRGSIEALGRVHWLLCAETPTELVTRHASLELYDLRHPEQQGLLLRQLPVETVPTVPVGDHRQAMAVCGITRTQAHEAHPGTTRQSAVGSGPWSVERRLFGLVCLGAWPRMGHGQLSELSDKHSSP